MKKTSHHQHPIKQRWNSASGDIGLRNDFTDAPKAARALRK
jgi:hypothetical protein